MRSHGRLEFGPEGDGDGLQGIVGSGRDPVFEKENLLGFGVGIPAGQAFEASLAPPSREPSREQDGPDEEGNGGIEDVEILYHGALSEVQGAMEAKPIRVTP